MASQNMLIFIAPDQGTEASDHDLWQCAQHVASTLSTLPKPKCSAKRPSIGL